MLKLNLVLNYSHYILLYKPPLRPLALTLMGGVLHTSIDYLLGRHKVDPRNGCVHHWIPVSRCQFLHGKTAERWEVIARNSDPLNGLKSDSVSLETSDSLPVLQVYLEHCRLELWPNVERHKLDTDWIHNSILEFYSWSVNCISTLLVELLL